MQLNEFARTLLFSRTLSEKLISPGSFDDDPERQTTFVAPHFPGRPRQLARIGKSEFPRLENLDSPVARGRLLHFFANHELLALELMALTLLKFPHAEPPFRLGLARTIVEEQKHLRLYVGRMNALGVEFGDLPVSDYFWNALKSVPTPLDFVVQMSLTLEQANLDYSFYYQDGLRRLGDETTADLLEVVYREEIGHVKHGLHWFNRWRRTGTSDDEDDWSAYLRLLPAPMTPRRAKGPIYCAAARRQAGFSERYIKEMEIFTGSKGRPPTFWFYNPLCEAEIARGKPGFTPSKKVQHLGFDLEALPLFLARETDVVLVRELPRAEWLQQLNGLGFSLPEFRVAPNERAGEQFRESKIAGFEPWGWSPDSFARFKPSRSKLCAVEGANGEWSRELLDRASFADSNLAQFFSKRWSVNFLADWMERHPEDATVFGPDSDRGSTFEDAVQAKEFLRGQLKRRVWLAKAPWGTSGTQNKQLRDESELDSNLGQWIENTVSAQGAIVLEPWLDKVYDLSVQIDIGKATTRTEGIRRFINGKTLEYRGTYLEPKLNSLSPDVLRFLHSRNARLSASPLERWVELTQSLAQKLQEGGYRGPAGVDALVYKDGETFYLRPVVELNPRWTMGRVAIEIERHVLPGTPAVWAFIPRKSLGSDTLKKWQMRHPVHVHHKGGDEKIAGGIVCTNDPERAREVLTLLIVGKTAVADLLF